MKNNNNWFVILLIIIAAIIVLPIAFNTVFLIATNLLKLILVIILAGAVAYTGVYFINDIKVNFKKEREELKLASVNNKTNDLALNDNNITPVMDNNNNFQTDSHAPVKLVELSKSSDEARKVVEAYDNTYNKISALAKGDCYSVSDFEDEFKDKMFSITSGLETYDRMVKNNIHDEVFETRVRYAVQSLIGQFDKAALKVFSNDVSDFNSKMHGILSENNDDKDSGFKTVNIINEGEPVEAETPEAKGSVEII